jgi:hypothetical protein
MLTLPSVYGPETTTCRYKGLLQEYVENNKPHHLTGSNRLHPSNLAQTIASILTRAKSHLNGWETTSHKDASQTQHHKGWKDLYDSHDCIAKHNYPSMNPKS